MKKIYKTLSLSSLAAITLAAPVALAVSCGGGSQGTATIPRNELHEYREISTKVGDSQRIFDVNFTSGNVFSGTSYDDSSRVLPLLRTHVTGKDVSHFDPATGKTVFTETKQEHLQFEGAKGIKVGTAASAPLITDPTDQALVADTDGTHTWRFVVDTNVKYVDYTGNETEYHLQGKDFFYGMMRTIYSNKEMRHDGLFEGKDLEGLDAFSPDEITALGAQLDEMDGSNNYLYNLFHVDLPATILANNATDKPVEEFIVKFTETPTLAALSGWFANNSAFSPVPSQRIDELNTGNVSTPGTKYGIVNYSRNLPDGHGGYNGYKDTLSVSPYFYSEYNASANGQIVLSKNTHYIDQEFATSPNTISKYVTHVLNAGGDQTAIQLQRFNDYKNGLTSELDPVVFDNAELMNQIRRSPEEFGLGYSKAVSVGLTNKLYWDFSFDPKTDLPAGKTFNDKGLKMMYGNNATFDNFATQPGLLDEFYNGNGKELRTIINNAINAYAFTQFGTSAQHKIPFRGPYLPETKLWSDDSTPWGSNSDGSIDESIFTKPDGMPTLAELTTQYDNNRSNSIEALKSPNFAALSTKLNTLATSVGATPTDKAIIPIQLWSWDDEALAAPIEKLYTDMFTVLNQLSTSVSFVRVSGGTTWDTFATAVQSDRTTQMHYAGWGPDYNRANSLAQGVYQLDYASLILGALSDITKDELSTELPLLEAEFNKESNKFPHITKEAVSGITQETIRAYNKGDTLDSDDATLLQEMNDFTQEAFLALSTNEAATTEIAKYIQDTSIIYTFRASSSQIITDRATGAAIETVKRPWFHPAISSDDTNLLVDARIDLD